MALNLDPPDDCAAAVIENASWRSTVRRRLLAWFRSHARDLPWRQQRMPYPIWISEVMLQQTQVATVIDYYNRFLIAFPDVRALAMADEEELMRLWEGLGYYRRARLMHQAAKQIVGTHAGEFPTDYRSVLALPGIGRYTAGAILSISSGARLPILEGNTTRVFSRWVAMRGDVKSKSGTQQLWDIAEAMLPRNRAGQFNQAAMELGALVCKPVDPRCDQCPVSSSCQAHRLGLQDSIPGKVTKMEYENRTEFAFVVPALDGAAWLVHRVADGERWAGLWDFPRVLDGATPTPADAAQTISQRLGLDLMPFRVIQRFKHAVTRFRITLEVCETQPIDRSSLSAAFGNYRFVTRQELASLPLSVSGRRIATHLLQSQ